MRSELFDSSSSKKPYMWQPCQPTPGQLPSTTYHTPEESDEPIRVNSEHKQQPCGSSLSQPSADNPLLQIKDTDSPATRDIKLRAQARRQEFVMQQSSQCR